MAQNPQLGGPTIARGRPRSLNNPGTLNSVTGLTHQEFGGSGPFRQVELTGTDVPITITDALAYASQLLYTFPEGRIQVLGCVASIRMTTTSAIASTLNSGATISWGIGSAAASNLTLATTMQNFMPGSGESVNNFTSSTVINEAAAQDNGVLASVAAALIAATLDGTTTPVPVYLNLAVPTNTEIDADATVTCTFKIVLSYVVQGDFPTL